MLPVSDFKTMRDALVSPLVSNRDKKRLVEVYRNVSLHGDDWPRKNTSIFTSNRHFIYKINKNKTMNLIKIQHFDMKKLIKIRKNA